VNELDAALCNTIKRQDLRIKHLEERLCEARTAVICALTQLLDLRDLNAGRHSTRVAEWAVRLAEVIGVDETYQSDLEAAALLHDIGKIAIPDAVLRKPGPLTPEEFAAVRKQSEVGWQILRTLPGFERVGLLVLHHTESVDGTGYPAGLSGREIPLGSRIIQLIHAFDAILTNRDYREPLSLDEALRCVRYASGTRFDPELVQYFLPLAGDQSAQVLELSSPRE
jgi:HD-GYP domain-containing protein (c-di-GMP phosphodiesterase class II)